MSKYGQAIGYFTFKAGGAQIDIRPKAGDNLTLMRIMSKAKNNEMLYFEEMNKFIFNLIKRDVPPNTPEEENELKMYVEFNITELTKEVMLGFRLTTEEKLQQIEDKQLNNSPN